MRTKCNFIIHLLHGSGISNKSRLHICCTLLLFVFLILSQGRDAAADENAPYVIASYNVQIRVTKQNIYYVTETFRVIYHQSEHYIYRNIPTINRIRRKDGSYTDVKAKVFNIECDTQSDITNYGDYIGVRLGDPNTVTVTGERTYTISYEYHMGNDVVDNADMFYYTITGSDWDSSMSNVTFSVVMPENIDKTNLDIMCGAIGSDQREGLYYDLDGNVLSGRLDTELELPPGEVITIRMTLPEGYFDAARQTGWPAVMAIVLSFAGMGIAFLMWWKLGKDDVVVETIQFHPPRGLNSLEVAYAVKGEADREDVLSLLVYLAQKGYIMIREESEKGQTANRSNFVFEKIKEYDGKNGAEKLFMQELFADGDIASKKYLENSFYKTVDKILRMMNSQRNKEVLFNKDSLNKHLLFVGMAAVSFFLSVFKPMYDYDHSLYNAIAIPVLFSVFFYFGSVAVFYAEGFLYKFMYGAPLFLALFAFFFQMCLTPLEYALPIYRTAFVICIIACLVILFFDHFMPKRTVYGTEILGRLRGFRTFLNTAEKDRLELLVEEDPQYFFEILPYTYVLDVSDVWVKKFESIAMESPGWYDTHHGASGFNIVQFNSFMRNTMDEALSSVNQKKKK